MKPQKLRVAKRILDLLDDTQMRVLIGHRTYREARLHAAIPLIMDTGLRISEAVALRDRDIDLQLNRVHQLREKTVPATTCWLGSVACRGRGARHHVMAPAVPDAEAPALRLAPPAAQLRDELPAAGRRYRATRVVLTTTQRYLHLLTSDLVETEQRTSVLSRLRG